MLKPIAALALVGACQSVPYRYYGLDIDRLEQPVAAKMKFYAAGDYPDLDGLDCWHAKGSAPRCTCAEEAEFVQMKADYAETKNRLEDCETRVLDDAEFQYRYYGLEMSQLTENEARSIDLLSADRRKYRDLSGIDCLNAVGSSPRCICMTDTTQLSLIADLRELQTRLDRCEEDQEGP